ncbi:keratinocyte proline-rich protein-like isoform X1 [Electrophorus electricus]|uniref:keratinocyte proline-rich protein-like isoform X1 n=1 Tax=Electrophorus electricus TaxID=8005 RepID=UPI0015CFE516|nr:keratinocyte proline-rich protein-like isoform X1 [Electrophorus electricus]
MQQEGFGPSHRVQSSPVQQPSRHTTRDTGLLPEAELGYMKTLLSMLKDGKPLVLPSLMATPSPVPVPGIVDAVAMNVPGRRDTTSPGPGARDAAHPCPGPVPGAREAARPDPVPAPGVRNAARPDPAPSARDATCPDQVLVPGTRDTAHPGPVPGLVVAACFCCQFCLGSCLWLQACSCEHSETRYPAMWHCYFLTCPSAYIHAYCVPCSCSYVGRT